MARRNIEEVLRSHAVGVVSALLVAGAVIAQRRAVDPRMLKSQPCWVYFQILRIAVGLMAQFRPLMVL